MACRHCRLVPHFDADGTACLEANNLLTLKR
jgi:hypothetical protein